MGAIASQITSLTIVYSTVYSGADQRNHQSSTLLAIVRGIHRCQVNSPHKWPVKRKMFPFDDVVMLMPNGQQAFTRINDGQFIWLHIVLLATTSFNAVARKVTMVFIKGLSYIRATRIFYAFGERIPVWAWFRIVIIKSVCFGEMWYCMLDITSVTRARTADLDMCQGLVRYPQLPGRHYAVRVWQGGLLGPKQGQC